MNPRKFCQESGYNGAILLTYNFDPVFFEKVVLRDLWTGDTGEILVIADQSEMESSRDRWIGRVNHLGRKYQIVPANVSGLFHLKIIIRFGANKVGVWLGSGNLTFGGWGGNQELATSFYYDEDDPVSRLLIGRIVDQIIPYLPETLEQPTFEQLLTDWSTSGLSNSNDELTESTVLFSNGKLSLSKQLEERWKGRRFDSVKILTGSTDVNGAQLKWLHETFGIKTATVIVDQNTGSFSPNKLQKLPLAVEVKHLPTSSPLHAKFYWFDGPEGQAAIMGSANCSAAAWLLPPNSKGNTEAIVVFDKPERSDYIPILQLFESKDLLGEDLKPYESSKPGTNLSLLAEAPKVYWEDSTELLIVSIPSARANIKSVCVEYDDLSFELVEVSETENRWETLAPGLSFGQSTTFVTVVVVFDDKSREECTVWVNELGELRNAAGGRKISDALLALTHSTRSADHNKILAGLMKINNSILNDTTLFSDPIVSRKAENEDNTDENSSADPIDPEAFVKSINDLNTSSKGILGTHGISSSLSLQSVFRAFFGVVEIHEEDPDLEEELEPSESTVNTDPLKRTPESVSGNPPDDKTKSKLYKSVTEFIDEIGEKEFFGECTATRINQALAYPLIIAVLGRIEGWVDDDMAFDWISRISDLAFNRKYPGHEESGILSIVKVRYTENDKLSDFVNVIGDGTLWLVLLSAVEELDWEFVNGSFSRSLVLRSIFYSRDLLSPNSASKVVQLLPRLSEKKVKFILEEAVVANQRLSDLESELSHRFDELKDLQRVTKPSYDEFDLLWIKSGWAEMQESVSFGEIAVAYHHAKGEEINVRTDYLVNVTKLAKEDSEIGKLFRLVDSSIGPSNA